VTLIQKTDYPRDGKVDLVVNPERDLKFTLKVRIPGWARGRPVPSDLYRYTDGIKTDWTLTVNGSPVERKPENGYAVITRIWKKGDRVSLDLPMPVRRVTAHEKVKDDVGRVALERGPLVYCMEARDNPGLSGHIYLPEHSVFTTEYRPNMLNGIIVIKAAGLKRFIDEAGKKQEQAAELTLVPYYSWCNRGPNRMAVWLPARAEFAVPASAPTIASKSRVTASHCFNEDSVDAVNDKIEPKNSNDHGISRFTWWDHKGGKEWIQYDFSKPTVICGIKVYWFDDTGRGECRVPRSWRILTREQDKWVPLKSENIPGVKKDCYNEVKFVPRKTNALRIEVKLQDDFSGGILEWTVTGK